MHSSQDFLYVYTGNLYSFSLFIELYDSVVRYGTMSKWSFVLFLIVELKEYYGNQHTLHSTVVTNLRLRSRLRLHKQFCAASAAINKHNITLHTVHSIMILDGTSWVECCPSIRIILYVCGTSQTAETCHAKQLNLRNLFSLFFINTHLG